MKRLCCGFALAVLLAACVAHEKDGDRAAAVGDWKSAYLSYRQALADAPDQPELKAKFERAREAALQDAQKRAQACAQVADWVCALAEADFALSIDGGNAEIATFRASAATQVALGRLDAAAEQAQRGQVQEAVTELQRATRLSPAPEVRRRAEQVRRLVVTQGRARAESLRQQGRLSEAHALAELVAGQDPALSGWAQGIALEYEQWLAAEYERLAAEGDAARARHDWALAEARYAEALELRQGGRAAPLAEYVRHVGRAEERLAARDWAGATEAYRTALRTGQDDGYARHQVERVEPRPYRVAIRSLLVMPTRPDGQTWTGPASPLFSRLARRLVEAAGRKGLSGAVVRLAMNLPEENRPQLRVEAQLPDGPLLTTPVRTGIYVDYDSELVLTANAFDERRVTFRVLMDAEGGPQTVGTVDVALRELAERREVVLEGGSVLVLELEATHAPGRVPGSSVAMTPVQPVLPPAPGSVTPRPQPPTGAQTATPVP